VCGGLCTGYKIINYSNRKKRDVAYVTVIKEEDRIHYYKNLWYNVEFTVNMVMENFEEEKDLIAFSELLPSYKMSKNRKAEVH
jgi:hypothetical protein